jgi:hypothetical protein
MKGLNLWEEAMKLLNVPSVGEDVAVVVLQSVGSWSDHLHNRVRSLPGWREFVLVLGRLCSPQYQIADFEGSTPDLPLLVPVKS